MSSVITKFSWLRVTGYYFLFLIYFLCAFVPLSLCAFLFSLHSLVKTLATGTKGKMLLLRVKIDEGTDRTLPEISLLFIQASEPFLPLLMNPDEKKKGQGEKKI